MTGTTAFSRIKRRILWLEIHHVLLIYSRSELTVTSSQTHAGILLSVAFRYLEQFHPEIREVLLTGCYCSAHVYAEQSSGNFLLAPGKEIKRRLKNVRPYFLKKSLLLLQETFTENPSDPLYTNLFYNNYSLLLIACGF